MSKSAFGIVHKAYTPNPKAVTQLKALAGQIAKPKKPKLTDDQVNRQWASTQAARKAERQG